MIVVEDLTRSYGSRVAVDRISFRVPRGEVVGFLGPNGAGKSTTLKVIAGYLPPTSGKVTVAGFDVADESLEARRHIGYMPESVPLYPEMRVEEYLSFRAEIKGVSRNRRAAVTTAMERADVADVARQLIGELSKGYKQRVGLADALVSSPDLLILDEPTAGLDPNQILHVRELIRSLGKTHTIFLSTHILPEVEAVCSRVVIIAKGRIAAEGTPDEIRARRAGAGRSADLVVRGEDSAVRSALEAVRGVRIDVAAREADSNAAAYREAAGVLRYTLDVDDTEGAAGERIEKVAAAITAAGLGLRGLELRGKSLEAIFHELTTSEADDETATAKKAIEKPPAEKPGAEGAS